MRQHAIVVGILVGLTVAVYGRVHSHELLYYDDHRYIVTNYHVQNGLSVPGVVWAFTTNLHSNWHPVTWLSLMLDTELFGSEPKVFHLFNVFWHLLNVILLYTLLIRMTGAWAPSAIVAAIFALHPLHVESVAWATERKDVLSTFFGFSALHAYLSYTIGGARRWHWYAAALCLLGLGLMSKAMLVTWPFVLLLLDFWPLERLGDRDNGWGLEPRLVKKRVFEKIPFFALVLASAFITFWVQRSEGSVAETAVLSWDVRISNALVSYVAYIVDTVWPSGLAVFYPYVKLEPDAISLLHLKAMAAAVTLAIATAMVWRLGKRNRYLVFGWLWYVGTLVPVIGLVQVGMQSRADRYMYVPLVGLSIMVVWGGYTWVQKKPHMAKSAAALMCLVVGLLSIGSFVQVGRWRNQLTLFQHALEVTTENEVTHLNVGVGYRWQGMDDAAIRHMAKSAELRPDAFQPYAQLGEIVLNYDNGQALKYFELSLERGGSIPQVYTGRGQALLGLGRPQEALQSFYAALAIFYEDPRVHNNVGGILASQGKFEEAEKHFATALEIVPNYESARQNLERLRSMKK